MKGLRIAAFSSLGLSWIPLLNMLVTILATAIVGLSIVMPIYYSYKRKKQKQKLDQLKF